MYRLTQICYKTFNNFVTFLHTSYFLTIFNTLIILIKYMFQNKFTLLFFVLLSFFSFQNTNAQLSKKHYLPPITSDDPIENQYIYISTPKNKSVSFKIIPIGQPKSQEITGTVSNTIPFSTSSFDIGNQLFQNSGSGATLITDKGYIIEANDVVYVTVRMRSQNTFQAAAIVSKGVSALGTNFRMGGFANTSPGGGHLNFISVMATENNTKVIFDEFTAGIRINNYSGTLPIEANLNEGESFIVSVSVDRGGDPNDLLGTLVNSDKPIVVNSGSATGSFHTSNGRDYGIDQLVDASKVGKEYIFVRGDGLNDWENILIVAHSDNTEIKINGGAVIAIINKSEWHVIEGDNYSFEGNMYVETSEPAFAFQGVGFGNSAANQGLFFVPPLNCESTGFVDNIPEIDKVGADIFDGGITVVTKKEGTLVIEEDSSNPNFTIDGPKSIIGNSAYVTYKVTNLSGNITVKSLVTNAMGNDVATELYCSYFNRNGAATSGGFYSGFPSAPEINFDATIETLGNCIGNDLKLQAANVDLFDSFEWFFDDGSGITSTGVTTPEIAPTLPGKYQLKGTISCSGSTFESSLVTVSICPDDYDNDAIIDNIDIDIDNDGILNCDESIGNATLNITNSTNPTIVFQDGSLDNSIASGSYTQTNSSGTNNTFIGDNLGNFTSTLNIANTSESKYQVDFTENINIKFSQDITQDHTISEGEFFVLKIGPNNKNITLLDPDDQLLIDTNFDNEYEAGITQISSSEIRFKYATDLTGANSTFQFVANQVEQIIFEHNSNALTTTSTFYGNIQLTCFTLDSDGDGIENMLDADSDNDGVPDLYDAFGNNIILTNTDANLDGLDDVFDTNLTNLDTDNDGVKNYLDIDSDNDGILDSTEANHNLDADFNGTVDSFSDTNKNGFIDSLEDASSNLNYTIADTDADGTFNFIELDADNDACFDVNEAGFTDTNEDGILDTSTFAVDKNGRVINNSDGYTNPNNDYITSAPITLNTTFEDIIFCENDTEKITIDSTSDTYQWEVSSDNGATFTSISNDATYSGATTKDLQITDTPLSFNEYQFRVLQTRIGNACSDISNAITLSVNPLPTIKNPIVTIKQCADNPNENTIVNLTEAEINISDNAKDTFTYFESEAEAISGNPEIADKERYPVTAGFAEAWVRTISEFNCYKISKIEITASFAGDVAYDKTFEECDDFLDVDGNDTADNSDSDGITVFDFSTAEQEVLDTFPATIRSDIQVLFYETSEDRNASINEIVDISSHRNNNNTAYAFNQTIYIKIKNKNNNDCEGIGLLFLKTNLIPEFNIEGEAPNEPIIICSKNIPYTLEAQNPADAYDYVWQDENGIQIGGNTQSIEISDGGNYTVTASSRDSKICSRARTIVVQRSSFETLNESFITITDDTSNSSSNLSIQIDIPVDPLNIEEFQYALEYENGTIFRSLQDSNIFNDIEGGVYNIVVENKNGCGTSELIVSVIQYPKFFTPNGDGINDTWLIKGANDTFYTNTNIKIFNRFGKLMAQIPIDSRGWDGTFNGKFVPSDNYWYNIQLIPIDTNKPTINKMGNFSLIRK